jgi:hypothetical protein
MAHLAAHQTLQTVSKLKLHSNAAFFVAVFLCVAGWLFLLEDGHRLLVAYGFFVALCNTTTGFTGVNLRDWAIQLAPTWLHWFAMNLAMVLPIAIVLMHRKAWGQAAAPTQRLPLAMHPAICYLMAFVLLCALSSLLGAFIQLSVPTLSLSVENSLTKPTNTAGNTIGFTAQSGIWILLACMAWGLRFSFFQKQEYSLASTKCTCNQLPSARLDSSLQQASKDAAKCCLDCFTWMALLLAFGLMQPLWMLLLTVATVAACLYQQYSRKAVV